MRWTLIPSVRAPARRCSASVRVLGVGHSVLNLAEAQQLSAMCKISTSSRRGQEARRMAPMRRPSALRAVLTRQRVRAACGCAGMPRAAGRTAPATGIDLT